MFINRVEVAMVFSSFASAIVMAQSSSFLVSGEAMIRERMALPPTAELEVTLDRVVNGKSSRVAQGVSILNGAQSPLKFTFLAQAASSGQSYTLRARVVNDGMTMFHTPQPVKYLPLAKIRTILPLVRASTSSVKGSKWTLISLQGEPLSLDMDKRPWITFSATNNELTGGTGLNNFGGTYALPGGWAQIDTGFMTLRAGSEESMRLEQSFLGMLGKANRYTSNGDRLHLLRGDKELAQFVRPVH